MATLKDYAKLQDFFGNKPPKSPRPLSSKFSTDIILDSIEQLSSIKASSITRDQFMFEQALVNLYANCQAMAYESGFDLDEAVDTAMKNAKEKLGEVKDKADAVIQKLHEAGIHIKAEDISVIDLSNMPDDESGFKAQLRKFIDEIEKTKKAPKTDEVKH